jgi:hypothetical protein
MWCQPGLCDSLILLRCFLYLPVRARKHKSGVERASHQRRFSLRLHRAKTPDSSSVDSLNAVVGYHKCGNQYCVKCPICNRWTGVASRATTCPECTQSATTLGRLRQARGNLAFRFGVLTVAALLLTCSKASPVWIMTFCLSGLVLSHCLASENEGGSSEMQKPGHKYLWYCVIHITCWVSATAILLFAPGYGLFPYSYRVADERNTAILQSPLHQVCARCRRPAILKETYTATGNSITAGQTSVYAFCSLHRNPPTTASPFWVEGSRTSSPWDGVVFFGVVVGLVAIWSTKRPRRGRFSLPPCVTFSPLPVQTRYGPVRLTSRAVESLHYVGVAKKTFWLVALVWFVAFFFQSDPWF